MAERKGVGCWMRLEWYTDPKGKPGEFTVQDRMFTGWDHDNLKHNIDAFITKYGIKKAYMLTKEQAEKHYGYESSEISTETIQKEVEEKE